MGNEYNMNKGLCCGSEDRKNKIAIYLDCKYNFCLRRKGVSVAANADICCDQEALNDPEIRALLCFANHVSNGCAMIYDKPWIQRRNIPKVDVI
ncbi:hypothetical protein EYC80_009444 [Monilinia laxa]|uniref:Uncharacterized protein n=1 Tax=Monilinia laxa TaxID=61186 RepID=A0A5N6JY15_MONLA|nr:hypothetical protein EYC80_009444 [Monilinia laxa]